MLMKFRKFGIYFILFIYLPTAQGQPTPQQDTCRVDLGDVQSSLALPNPQAELALMVDVSAEPVGLPLQQRAASAAPWESLGFFS